MVTGGTVAASNNYEGQRCGYLSASFQRQQFLNAAAPGASCCFDSGTKRTVCLNARNFLIKIFSLDFLSSEPAS